MVAMGRMGEPHVQRVTRPPCGKFAKRESPRRLTSNKCVVTHYITCYVDSSLDGAGTMLSWFGASSFELIQYFEQVTVEK